MITGQQFGRYEIGSLIGAGGMGEVYSAHDPELGRDVAIKLLPAEFTADEERRSRFRQEARVVSALNHPNILTIYEIGETLHGSFLATELVEGQTLSEIIRKETLSLTRILRIVEQVANALTAAHHSQIVHRDIKPDNIMVRQDLIVKVLDFGLAKPAFALGANGDAENNKTIPGTVMGSARYMSPEQARGLDVDERTDIWSLGVVLYEMLAGVSPFSGATAADTIAAVIYQEPEPIARVMPNTPVDLQRIIRKALQKDRDERYQSVKDMALDIKEVLYDLEHADSGGRAGHSTSSPAFSESATMIHKTISANHPTDKTNIRTSVHPVSVADATRTRRWPAALAAAAAVLLIGSASLGVYNWIAASSPMAVTAFERPQISRITSDGKVALPAISPDGKYIAYVSGEVGSRSLVVRQIATDSIVTIVPPSNLNIQFPAFSPDGNYIYYTQTRSDFVVSTLFSIPTLGGTPKKLIEDVDSGVTFSPDGKQFAFVRHATNTNTDNIFLVNSDTLAAEQLLSSGDTGYDFFVPRLAWAPDGKKIIVGAGTRQNGFVAKTEIAELSVTERSLRPINTKEFFAVGNFVWLADGSGLLFTGRESQNDPAQIWRAAYPEFELRQVTNDFNDYLDLGLSADGQNLITLKSDASASVWRYNSVTKTNIQLSTESRNLDGMYGIIERPDGGLVFTRSESKYSDIWASDADGRNPRALVTDQGFAVAPVNSPDGRYIIFVRQKDKLSRIWRINADGTDPKQLSEEGTDFGDFAPQIMPDGTSIIFHRQTANVELSRLMKMPIDGGPAEVFLEDKDHSVFQPRVSPDGRRIAYIAYNVNTFEKKLQVASVDEGVFGKVERDVEYNLIERFQWSADGGSLTALTNRSGVQNIWKLPVDGSPAAPVTDFKSGRIFNFVWSSDGKHMLITRGNITNDLILIRDIGNAASRAELTRSSKSRVAPWSL